MQDPTFGVALIGCGYVGKKRLEAIRRTGLGKVIGIFDADPARARELSEDFKVPVAAEPIALVNDKSVNAVIVATPNQSLARYGCLALEGGKHVLVEKPGAISVGEIISLEKHRRAGRELQCKIGYNLRFHPAAQKIKGLLAGESVLWVRGAYGHGGRPGYEKEWRFQREISGGGQFIDQGVHLLDLLAWWVDELFEVVASSRQNAYYRSSEEDNGFLLLASPSGVHAQFHTSATQWKNLFRMEVATRDSLFIWEGLGNEAYGPETLIIYRRNPGGGAPSEAREVFASAAEESWSAEWEHFYKCINGKGALYSTVEEGIGIFHFLDDVHQGPVVKA